LVRYNLYSSDIRLVAKIKVQVLSRQIRSWSLQPAD